MLVIVSKSFNSILSNFKYSKVFARTILTFSFFFVVIISFLFDFTFQKLFFITLVVIVFDLLLLYTIGLKRKQEIEEIKSIIKSIRKNQITSVEEIKLSKSLSDLEGNIKAMLQRTQNDIANMQKLAQARTDFLGYVSHELRTPIFTIQGYLETLLNGAVDDPKVNRKFLEKASNHSENLNSLLNDLIDISMIEFGQMKLSFRYFNLAEFLEETILEHVQYAEDKNNKLMVPEFNKEIEVYADKERLQQVFNNLISNAIKYTINGVVKIIIEEKSKGVLIKIKDTGMGIKFEEMDKIFHRFYRTSDARNKSIPGTGLGLAIVKHIIEAHNSKIEVKSKLGIGTEFSFLLKKA